MTKLLLILAGAVALILFITLEGLRQRRSLARRGLQTGERPSLIGVGMLELQSMLEPDRKVEIIQVEMRDRDRQHPEYRAALPTDAEADADRDADRDGDAAEPRKDR